MSSTDVNIQSLAKSGDIIKIEFSSSKNAVIESCYLFDSSGYLVDKNSTGRFNTSSLQPGVYYVKVVLGQETVIKKIVIID